MLKHLLLIAALGAAIPSQAIIWHYGEYSGSKKTCAVTGWSGTEPSSGKLSVPSSYTHSNGTTYTVTKIASGALNGLQTVTEIVIPASVTTIGSAEYSSSVNLNGVAENFYDCPQLKRFTVDAANKMFRSSSGGALFYKTSVALLRVPQKMAVSGGVFKLPDDATHVAPMAFAENTTTKVLQIPGDASVGYNGGFNLAPNLEEFQIMGSEMTLKLKNGALIDLVSERLVSVPPAGKTSSVSLPSSVKELSYNACYGATALKSITMPGVTDISKHVFKGSGVESLDFPATLKRMSAEALAEAPALKSIKFKSKDLRLLEGFAYNCQALESVESDYPFSQIWDHAFRNCRELKTFPFSGSTSMIGDSIFYNCGFEKVVYDSTPINNDFIGHYLFAYNRRLTEIDCSEVATGPGMDSFLYTPGFGKDCLQLGKLIAPRFSSFTHSTDSGNPSLASEPAFSNTRLMHIELGSFWAQEGDRPFSYSPFSGQTDIRPDVYIAVTRNYDLSDRYNQMPLADMFSGGNGAVVTPNFYCDAFSPADRYVAPRGVYYVPGGTLPNYSEAVLAGREVKEMFALSVNRQADRMRLQIVTTLGVSDVRVRFNDGEPVPLSGVTVTSDISYASIDHFTILYCMNEVELSTRYESSFWDGSGIEEIIEEESNDMEVYDIQGRRISRGNPGEIINSRSERIYILENGKKVIGGRH